jgi:hypothetical protein
MEKFNFDKNKDSQLDIIFPEDKNLSCENKEANKDSFSEKIKTRQEELDELYKKDPDHPEEYWQK